MCPDDWDVMAVLSVEYRTGLETEYQLMSRCSVCLQSTQFMETGYGQSNPPCLSQVFVNILENFLNQAIGTIQSLPPQCRYFFMNMHYALKVVFSQDWFIFCIKHQTNINFWNRLGWNELL